MSTLACEPCPDDNTAEWSCPSCPKSYGNKFSLLVHRRLQHGLKTPYECTVCNLSFPQSSDLTTHIKIEHEDKLIQCPHCPRTFRSPSGMRTHRTNVHKDAPTGVKLQFVDRGSCAAPLAEKSSRHRSRAAVRTKPVPATIAALTASNNKRPASPPPEPPASKSQRLRGGFEPTPVEINAFVSESEPIWQPPQVKPLLSSMASLEACWPADAPASFSVCSDALATTKAEDWLEPMLLDINTKAADIFSTALPDLPPVLKRFASSWRLLFA